MGGASRRWFGSWLIGLWIVATAGSPLAAVLVLASASLDAGEGGPGATGLAFVLLSLTQAAVAAIVAIALALVTAARLAALGWPRWWALLGAAPVGPALLAVAWPPLSLLLLPFGGANGLGFGMALVLWLLSDRPASERPR